MSNRTGLSALILAAGKGTRMKSRLPKVMQPLLEEPMIYYVIAALRESGIDDLAVVVGHGGEHVVNWLEAHEPGVAILWQREQLGTGHAVMMAADWLPDRDDVMVVNGDMPMLRGCDLRRFIDLGSGADWSFVTCRLDDPRGYGRVIRTAEGVSVVEHKDATEEQLLVDEVNVGLYRASGKAFLEGLQTLRSDNSQGEYYIVDLLSWAVSQGHNVRPVELDESLSFSGINDPAELARLGTAMRDRILFQWMAGGAKCVDPSSVWISPRASFEGEVFLAPHVQVWGATRLADGCSVGTGSVLRDCTFGPSVRCNQYVVAENVIADEGAVLGPFCYVRERTRLHRRSFAGKFVELKHTDVGEGSKVPHLSYLGDARIGKDTNVGAATVTCNYDGAKKHETIIGDHCFIGSDTMLVAPVTLGDQVTTAAGSVITQDVPSCSLAIGRSRQVNKEGWCRQGSAAKAETEAEQCSQQTEK